MNTILKLSIFTLFTFAYLTISFADTEQKDVWKSSVLTNLSSLDNYKITYNVKNYFKSKTTQRDNLEKEITSIKEVINKQKEGIPLTEEEKIKFEDVSDLETLLEIKQRKLDDYYIEQLYVFNKNQDKIRIDVFSNDPEQPNHYYYLFDGKNSGVVFVDEKRITNSSSITTLFFTPRYTPLYGTNLSHFLEYGYTIDSFNPDINSVTLKSDIYAPNWSFDFKLLENNDVYWKECVSKKNGTPFVKYVCENFKQKR